MVNYLKNKRALIIGASSDLAVDLITVLIESGCYCGLHYNTNIDPLIQYETNERVMLIRKSLETQQDCYKIVDMFIDRFERIDFLIILVGNIRQPLHWERLDYDHWMYDFNINLFCPFFIAQRAIKNMRENGGKIVFISTSSAKRGGGTTSLAYGASKYAVECVTKRLAKDCAQYNILVNAIAPGFIMTKFHTDKMERNIHDLNERAKLIPLKRPGNIKDFTNAVMFLIGEGNSFVTGQVIDIDGGDFI